VDNPSYPPVAVNVQLTLTTPTNATGPVPVLLDLGFIGGSRGGTGKCGQRRAKLAAATAFRDRIQVRTTTAFW